MRWPLNSAKALGGYGSDCARTKRSMTSAGQDQSTWLSCGARLWKNVACDRSCGVQSVRPDAIRSRASSVMGADHVDRAVEQIGDGVGRADRRRSLQHDVARIEFLVHQVRREPDFFFAVDQSPDERGGEARVLGQQRIVDVEGAVLRCVEDSAGNQVRQLLATMMSGAASASAALNASSGLFAT